MILAKRQRAQATPRVAPKPLRLGRWLAAAGLLASVVLGPHLLSLVVKPGDFPIRKVKVDGDFRFLAPEQIETLVSSAVQGGFFEVDVQKIQARILQEPWVLEATVVRAWPDAIRVSIREQRPVARWGPDALLSAQARVFKPRNKQLPEGMAVLFGPHGSEAEVWSAYQQIQSTLDPLALKVAAVELTDRRAWRVTLADGASLILGRHFVEERLLRFTRAWPSVLEPNWSRVASLDLRYTNGFAVRPRAAAAGSEPTRKPMTDSPSNAKSTGR